MTTPGEDTPTVMRYAEPRHPSIDFDTESLNIAIEFDSVSSYGGTEARAKRNANPPPIPRIPSVNIDLDGLVPIAPAQEVSSFRVKSKTTRPSPQPVASAPTRRYQPPTARYSAVVNGPQYDPAFTLTGNAALRRQVFIALSCFVSVVTAIVIGGLLFRFGIDVEALLLSFFAMSVLCTVAWFGFLLGVSFGRDIR